MPGDNPPIPETENEGVEKGPNSGCFPLKGCAGEVSTVSLVEGHPLRESDEAPKNPAQACSCRAFVCQASADFGGSNEGQQGEQQESRKAKGCKQQDGLLQQGCGLHRQQDGLLCESPTSWVWNRSQRVVHTSFACSSFISCCLYHRPS